MKERTGHGHIAMQAVRKKKGVSSSGCYECGQKSHMARGCKSKSDNGQSRSKKARVLQVWATWTFCKGASSVRNLDILQGSTSKGGQGSSVVVPQLQ